MNCTQFLCHSFRSSSQKNTNTEASTEQQQQQQQQPYKPINVVKKQKLIPKKIEPSSVQLDFFGRTIKTPVKASSGMLEYSRIQKLKFITFLEDFAFFFLIDPQFLGVTEQHCVSIFFTRLWSMCKPLLFDTQNPGISGFSTAHAYKYKTKRQAKMKREK